MRSGRFNFLVWLSGATLRLFAAVTGAVFLFRDLCLALRRETTRGSGQEKIGGGESVQRGFVLSGISGELHKIAAGVTPFTLTRWFSSRFVRLNCQKYA